MQGEHTGENSKGLRQLGIHDFTSLPGRTESWKPYIFKMCFADPRMTEPHATSPLPPPQRSFAFNPSH